MSTTPLLKELIHIRLDLVFVVHEYKKSLMASYSLSVFLFIFLTDSFITLYHDTVFKEAIVLRTLV